MTRTQKHTLEFLQQVSVFTFTNGRVFLREQVLIRRQIQVIHSKTRQQERHEALKHTHTLFRNALQLLS